MSTTIQLGANTLDLVRGELVGPTGSCSLTELEAAFLAYLGRRMGTLVAKSELLREVWGYRDSVQSRTLDTAVFRIRGKLGNTGLELESVRGRGIALRTTQLVSPATTPDRPALIGRSAELALLQASLSTPGLVCLWGPPGVGKTALASWIDGTHTLQGTGVPALEREVCDALSCTPADLLHALRADGRIWVLDETESRRPDELELVWAWATVAPVLVVGTLKLEARTDLRLAPLSEADAVALLVRLANVSEGVAAQVVRQTDRLPRQIALLARAIGFLGVDDLIELGGGSFPVLENAVEALWEGLEPDEREVLTAVTVFHDQFCIRAVAHVTGRRPFELLPVMERLWSKSLVQGERGVFRLLAPVRTVASRHAIAARGKDLTSWCVWLLEENSQHGQRWTRHLDDLGYVLQHCDDHDAAFVGVLLLEHAAEGRDVTGLLRAASMREGSPRRVVIALQALLAVLYTDVDGARALLPYLQEPMQTPASELLRRAAVLVLGPRDGPADPLLELEHDVPFVLFVAVFCVCAGFGWHPAADLCERYAIVSEQLDLPSARIALYTWATRTARNQGDPRWVDLAPHGSAEVRLTLPLRQGQPEQALDAALALLETATGSGDRFLAAGMAACLLLTFGRDAEAGALIDRYPSAGDGESTYLHLASAVLGQPSAFSMPAIAELVDRWRSGKPPVVDPDTTSNQVFFFAWVMQRRAPAPLPPHLEPR